MAVVEEGLRALLPGIGLEQVLDILVAQDVCEVDVLAGCTRADLQGLSLMCTPRPGKSTVSGLACTVRSKVPCTGLVRALYGALGQPLVFCLASAVQRKPSKKYQNYSIKNIKSVVKR